MRIFIVVNDRFLLNALLGHGQVDVDDAVRLRARW